jgi:hypothetical protein
MSQCEAKRTADETRLRDAPHLDADRGPQAEELATALAKALANAIDTRHADR